jgi:galactokinase
MRGRLVSLHPPSATPHAACPAPDFKTLFGRPAELSASAPGRVNLIGEHTDYNGGFVLPTVIPQKTVVEIARRQDRLVRVWSDGFPGDGVVAYELGTERRADRWLDYVQGMTWVLASAGHRLGGIDARITSSVPLGSGLSSSAALEVSFARGLREAFGLAIADVPLALLARQAENEFVGAPVGIMDQMACLLAGDRHALFLDTRSLAYESLPLPARAELAVINSGVAHNHAHGDYRTRRAECEKACDLLGTGQLRDLGLDDLPRLAALPEPLGRRARHVVTEDARVLMAVEALRSGDCECLGRLFDASHQSMRDDYEVSVPEVDLLVELARADRHVYGTRLTGGGFGGAIVALVETGHAGAVAAQVAATYARLSGRTPTVLVPPPVGAVA